MPLSAEDKLEFVANVLKSATAFSMDWTQFAKDNGISRGDHASSKFKGIIESTGKFTVSGGRVYAKDDPSVPATPGKAAGRPKKTDGKPAAKKDAKETAKKDGAKPASKKRKVEKTEAQAEENGDEEVKGEGDD